MRPLSLKMTAFGPYKHTENIDFNDLKGNQLFVISGSTGAGKTTIFDGICFALYGSASGEDRSESRNMRSDFAEDDVHTSVEMEFEIHNRTYRILRQMGHVKKGNKSATGEKYEFFEKLSDREIPCVERQIVSEINPKVEQIIGLSINQFSQIVMLPQGEFRKLLTSDTENKEEILRKIFKTEPYKVITERLKRKKTQVEDELKIEHRSTNSYIQNIESVLPTRESSLFQTLAQDQYNINQILAGLTEEVSYYNAKITRDQNKYDHAYKEHTTKSNEFHQAQSLNERFAEWEMKEQKLKSLNTELPLFNDKEKQLERAERAILIEAIERQFRDLQQEMIEKERTLNAAYNSEVKAKEKLEQINLLYIEEEKKLPQREQLAATLIRLSDFLPIVKELDTKEFELKAVQTQVVELNSSFQLIDRQVTTGNESLQELKQEIDQLENRLVMFDEHVQTLADLNDQCRVLKEFLTIQQALHVQESDVINNERKYKEVNETYMNLERQWFDNQARVLAAHLHDGDACPVCGSVEHPNKNEQDQTLSPSKEELEQSKAMLNQVDSHYRNVRAKQSALSEQLDKKGEELTTFGIDGQQLSEVYKTMDESRSKVNLEVSTMRKDKAKLVEMKKQHQVQYVKVEELQLRKAQVEKTYQEMHSTYEKLIAIYDDKLQSIPNEIRVLAQLERQIKETNVYKHQLEHTWATVQQQRQDAKEQHSSSLLTVKHTELAVQETNDKKDKADIQFKTALKNSSFDFEEDYQLARLSRNSMVALKEEINEFKQARHTLSEQVAELNTLLENKVKVDLTVLQSELTTMKHAYETALNEVNQAMDYKKAADQLIVKISNSHEKSMLKEREFNQITDLHDVIRGHNGLKISFERYLQIEYLEQILVSANERLKNLSNGQFHLIRSERQESRGRQSGLGLDVYDAYTGQTRDVKTLSGGEKFNASLCLALGMADVIQSFQGNVSIDTMFIDEGFGSLDEESLNKSIDTLIDLQKSGRMIGVISHVQELKTAIPAILEVKKSKEGFSQTRFVLK